MTQNQDCKPCVLVPTYNNARTLVEVVRDAAAHAPVIVVDDGCTDETAELLAAELREALKKGREALSELTVLTHEENRGKGQALVTGFLHARQAGFTHAITIDSDGQHLAEDIPRFLQASEEKPDALILGNRDLEAAGAGFGSRFGRTFSNFWVFVETGHRLPDSQTGFRSYPLETICSLHLDTKGYDFEFEILVKASWSGVPLASAPVQVRYFAGDERVSHFRPFADFWRISKLNTRLCFLRVCFPLPYLGLRSRRRFHELGFRERLKQSFVELFVREPGSPRRIAGSVGLGLFMGIVPFWGLQIALTIMLSHVFNASKTIAVVAANISFPLMIPPILYASLVLGRMALGNGERVADWSTLELTPSDFWAWVLGSFILATIVAVAGALITYLITTNYKNLKKPPGRRRFVPLVTASLVMAAGAWFGSRLDLDNDVSRLLPDSTSEMSRMTSALTRMMERTVVDVGPGDRSGDRPIAREELGRIADEFATRLQATGHVRRVRASVDPSDALPMVALLRERAPLLLDQADLDSITAATEPDRVVATVQQLARRLQEPDGAALKSRAAVDPLGLTDRVLAPLGSLGEGFRGARLLDGRLVSEDRQHVLVLVEVGFPANDTDRATEYVEAVQRVARELERDPKNHGVRIRHFGAHRSTLDNVDQIRGDVLLTSSIGGACVALLAIMCFGRFWLALLALTPAVCGGLVALGVFSLFADSIAGAVLGFGAVLLGLTIDFAIHVLFRLDRGSSRLPVRALYMGGTTTSLAFVALLASSLPAVREIGVFGAIGVFVAVLFALYVLPSMVRTRSGARPIVDLVAIAGKLRRPATAALVVALLATPFVGVGVFFVTLDGNPNNLSKLSPDAERDQNAIFATWGRATQITNLVVEAPELADALAANDRLAEWLEDRKGEGAIDGHGSVAGLLPAPETQRIRLAAWRTYWTDDKLTALRRALRKATDASPFRTGAFDPFLEWLDRSPGVLSFEEQSDGPLGDVLAERIYEDDGVWRASTPVYTADWPQTEALARRLQNELPEVTLLNKQVFSRKLASMVTGEIVLLGVIALALVSLVVFIWHGRVVISAVIVLPLLLSLLWTLGLLGWCGIPISLANAIFVVFLFGIAVDYSIFLTTSRLDRFRTGDDRTLEAQAAVLLCTLTTCAGFGALAFAGHPVMHSIGLTALIGIASAALATQIFVPAMTNALVRERGPNGTPGLHNLLACFSPLWVLGGGGILHLLGRRRQKPVGAEGQRATIRAIHRMCRRVQDRLPNGRRRYENLDKMLEEPCILVANHESMYDIVGILALPQPMQILVKEWVWRTPLVGSTVRAAGYPLVRDKDPEAMLDQVAASLQNGVSLLLFPEGRRTRSGKMGRFHNGAFAMARRLGVKVQPIAMVNTREVVRPGSWWVGDHDSLISVLDPMDPADFAGDGGDRRMALAARDRVQKKCRDAWLETQNGPSWYRLVSGMYRYLGPLVSHYAVSKCKRDPLVKELPSLCRGEGPILVAGGGLGLMTARLALAYPERAIRCLDLDERKLEYARAALGDHYSVEFVTADLRATELEAVDVALLIDVLHYWDAETQAAIVRRIATALPAGGTLLFRDSCSEHGKHHRLVFAQELFAVLTGFTRGQGKFLFRSESGWRELLEECEFEVLESRADLGSFSNVVLVCRRR